VVVDIKSMQSDTLCGIHLFTSIFSIESRGLKYLRVWLPEEVTVIFY